MKNSFLLLVLIVVLIFYQALTPFWMPHLASDVNNYYFKAEYFLQNGNLTNLPVNEYQPGAIFYLMIFSPVLNWMNAIESYRLAMMLGNALFILGIGWFYLRKRGERGMVIYSLLICSIGPLLLYRFELLVVSLFIFSLHFWSLSKPQMAHFFLGLATTVKVYPIILLPYFLLVTYRKEAFGGVVKGFLSYIVGLILPVIVYVYFFKVSFASILDGLTFHGNKPIDTEGIWSVLHTTYYLLTQGAFPVAAPSWGINGITGEFTIGPIWFYNSLWLVVIGIIYLWIFLKKKLWEKFNVKLVILILLLFLSFSKVMAPQYLIWVILLLPLLNINDLKRKFWVKNLILAFLIMILYQIIYPLNFDEWLAAFHNRGFSNLFWVNLLRNLLLFWLLYRVVKDVIYESHR